MTSNADHTTRRRAIRAISATAIIALAGTVAIATAGSGAGGTKATKATPASPYPADLIPKTATATCAKGRHVVLGGVKSPTDNDVQEISRISASGKRSWKATAINAHFAPGSITAIAYCRKGGPKLHAVSKTKTLPIADSADDPPSKVTARCPHGQRVAFGGFSTKQTFDTKYPNVYIGGLERTSKRAWTATAMSFEVGQKLTSIAYCGKRLPATTTVTKNVDLAAVVPGTAVARCPKHKRLAFGGFKGDLTYTNQFVIFRGMLRSSKRGWKVTGISDSSPGRLTAIAYCA